MAAPATRHPVAVWQCWLTLSALLAVSISASLTGVAAAIAVAIAACTAGRAASCIAAAAGTASRGCTSQQETQEAHAITVSPPCQCRCASQQVTVGVQCCTAFVWFAVSA